LRAAPPTTSQTVRSAPSCADVKAARKSLDEQRKWIDQVLEDDEDARELSRQAIEDRKRLLDEQRKTCVRP
jgi:predicted metal-dependent hydrolase